MKRKATDERDRLRELLKAYAEHTDVDAFRVEWAMQNDGTMRCVCTHARGVDAEAYMAELIAKLLWALGVRSADPATSKPEKFDDVVNEPEKAT